MSPPVRGSCLVLTITGSPSSPLFFSKLGACVGLHTTPIAPACLGIFCCAVVFVVPSTGSDHGILQHISFHCAPFSLTWQSGHCAVFTVDVQCHFDRGAVIAQPRWLCTSVLPIPADSVYLSTVTVAHLFIAAQVLSALVLGHCPIRRYMGCA